MDRNRIIADILSGNGARLPDPPERRRQLARIVGAGEEAEDRYTDPTGNVADGPIAGASLVQGEWRPYTPTWRDKIASWLIGDERPSAAKRRFVEGLMGGTGLGTTGMGLIDIVPGGQVLAAQEAAREGDAQGFALALMPLPAARLARPGRNVLASKAASIYDPPVKPARPFEADYPAGAPADATGRLTHTIDGDEITARYVVGRRTLGGHDEALTPAQLDALAEKLTGAPPQGVAAREIRGNAGVFRREYDPAGNPDYKIFVDKALDGTSRDRVVAHELSHAIDYFAGKPYVDEKGLWSSIPTRGPVKPLREVYNDLNNPELAGRRAANPHVDPASNRILRNYGPEKLGYSKGEVPRELNAEAIRAYMTDPNYFKTVAPKTAAEIRAAVNANPRLAPHIQFNSIGAGLGWAGLFGLAHPDNEREQR